MFLVKVFNYVVDFDNFEVLVDFRVFLLLSSYRETSNDMNKYQ